MTARILAVTGSRHWADYSTVWRLLAEDYLIRGYRVLVHGACPRGADAMAQHAGERIGYLIKAYPVNEAIDGAWPGAGMARNRRMLVTAQPHAIRAFRAAGKSPGTDGCIALARKMGIEVLP